MIWAFVDLDRGQTSNGRSICYFYGTEERPRLDTHMTDTNSDNDLGLCQFGWRIECMNQNAHDLDLCQMLIRTEDRHPNEIALQQALKCVRPRCLCPQHNF